MRPMMTTTIMTSMREKAGRERATKRRSDEATQGKTKIDVAVEGLSFPFVASSLRSFDALLSLLNRIPRLQNRQHGRHHDEQHDHRQHDDQQRLEDGGEALGGGVDLLIVHA